MYRYSVDNSITYSSEDLVLFRASPFACWMERLTLENPEHGIPSDLGSNTLATRMERQDAIADTLSAEGKRVRLVEWEEVEPARRKATLDAMRGGVDFIVNGQLALGPLSGPVNLLMRTSGYSELGDFLYILCDTQMATTEDSTFRLCFLADLLHSLQGQLPPQMLVIRGGEDLVPLQTEDHIYHYRAVKQRFMAAMRDFRKHRMPDPAESAHFGRWSECAREVLKQRLLREEQQVQLAPAGSREEQLSGKLRAPEEGADALPALDDIVLEIPLGRAVGAGETPYDLDEVGHGAPSARENDASSGTGHNRRLADAALQNLEFIGRHQAPDISASAPDPQLSPLSSTAPAPSLRDPRVALARRKPIATPPPGLGRSDRPPEESKAKLPGRECGERPWVAESTRQPSGGNRSVIDLDSNDYPLPPAALATADTAIAGDVCADEARVRAALDQGQAERRERKSGAPFSDSLITGPDLDS